MSNTLLPRVTFGLVNCNRLYYLKSCLESIVDCTYDYPNVEIIVVDNASIEEGTDEYLKELKERGVLVHRTAHRDPANEYPRALNYIVKNATGDFVCPLAGDMQFVVKGGWLERYVKLYMENLGKIGCIPFDAQRRVTNQSHQYSEALEVEGMRFLCDFSRPPIATSANAMFYRENLNLVGQWNTNNMSHEGGTHGEDAESKMWSKVKELHDNGTVKWNQILPIVPVSVAIWTDPRGSSVRVRGNKRYGKYFEPKEEYMYYKVRSFEEAMKLDDFKRLVPVEIETIAVGVGWDVPIDETGSWKKNPIIPFESKEGEFAPGLRAKEDEGTILEPNLVIAESDHAPEETPEYIDNWLNGDD